MKRTPLKRSDKPMAHGGLPAPTKAQKAVFDKLIDQVGCAVCLFVLRIEGSEGEIHHLLVGGNRVSHDLVIPLCPTHHRGTHSGYICRHSVNGDDGGLSAFEEAYGTEYSLMESCERWINVDYSHSYNPDGLLTDEQAPQGDDRDPNSDADDHRDHIDVQEESIPLLPLQTFGKRVRVTVMHHRVRKADPDNLNAKGALDGLVKAGLLQDDSPKYVEGIYHDQVKVKSYDEEKTVITLEEIAA